MWSPNVRHCGYSLFQGVLSTHNTAYVVELGNSILFNIVHCIHAVGTRVYSVSTVQLHPWLVAFEWEIFLV